MDVDYSLWIVSPKGFKHSDAFHDIAICLQAALRKLSRTATIVRHPKKIKGCGIALGTNLISDIRMRNLPPNLVLFNLEQIQKDSCWVNEAYIELLKSYPVWDYSFNNIKALLSFGIKNVSYCGLGYEDILTKIKTQKESIDVLFYGSPNKRRDKILNELSNNNVKVVQLFGVYGKERDAYIAKAKIVLNIHYYDASIFESARIIYLLANKKFVVSETGKDHFLENPFRGGLIFAEYQNLVQTCLDYLEKTNKRDVISNRGFQIIRGIRQSDFLRPLI